MHQAAALLDNTTKESGDTVWMCHLSGGAHSQQENVMTEVFNLRSRPDAYQTGMTSSGDLAVMGMLFPWAVAVFFRPDGAFSAVQQEPLNIDARPSQRFEPFVEAHFLAVLHAWQQKLGFKESPIQVQAFFLSDYRIGIRELPLDLQDYMDNPVQYPEEDQEEFTNDIDSWKAEGNFVFTWGIDYHVSREGETF